MRRINWRAWLILLLLCSLGCTWIFLRLLRPIVLEYAQNLVQQTASYAIHDTLTDVIYQNRAQYEDLVTLERDNENQVTALKTDTILADYLKVQLSRAAYDALNTLEQGGVDIPLGSVFFPTLFAGRGPTIHVGVASLGYADADFISAFTSAGINQTAYRVVMKMSLQVTAVTAFARETVTVPYETVAAEVLVVGDVPVVYAYGGEIRETP